MEQPRKILHIDMDAFYASVEQRDRPELRGKPVVVAWSEAPRSVVLAASYEARTFGVRSAMPALRARRLCPDAEFVRPDFTRYTEVSRQIREIFSRHTELVEPLSLDEAYLDVTHELTGIATATETARTIRAEIREETNLTASAGVAANKFLAKIASDWKKPDGLFVIRPRDAEQFLTPLPVTRIPGVGKATEKLLHEQGIKTIGDLRRFAREELAGIFGRFGERLWELCRGIDPSPVVAHRKAKSISSEQTFAVDHSLDELADYFMEASAEVWNQVLKHNRIGRTVTVKLRTSDFRTATRRATPLKTPRSAAEMGEVVRDLAKKFTFGSEARYRLAGVGLSNFLDEEAEEGQQKLF